MIASRRKRKGVGGRYILLICASTIGLLIINILLVDIFIRSNINWLWAIYPDEKVQFRLAQGAQIFLPVVMTMLQFWLFDRIVDRAFGYGHPTRSAD